MRKRNAERLSSVFFQNLLHTFVFSAITGVLGSARVPAAEPAERPSAAAASGTEVVDFEKEIRPIFREHCVGCHGPEKQKSGLRLDRRREALRGGDNLGPDIVPGKSAESPLIRLVSGLDPDRRMPARGEPLIPEQIRLLKTWIDQGAAWPDDATAGAPDPALKHWAFRPVIRPPVPMAPDGAPPAVNPVDGFIRARLAEDHLAPSPEADRRTLIRRLSFDLVGLPPTPAEVAAFVSDDRPGAYAELVDRLLASPHFGERWARHWLDVVRYAETHGFEMNNPRPNAWRYRDYVIRAFNEDVPYDRFVVEQLAGDAVGVDEATGFLVAGAWDQVKSPDVVLTRNQRADELHDMVNTTGTAFLALTLGCARCHDHKFDPIPQTDYYAIKAILAGVQHGERELRPADYAERTNKVAALRGELQHLQDRMDALEPVAVVDTAGSGSGGDAGPRRLRRAVASTKNVDRIQPTEARFLRFTVTATTGGEPCLDELEVFIPPDESKDGGAARNIALADHGTRATASGTYSGLAFHKLEHINDGRYGNARSWISNEAGKGWVQLEFPGVERIGRVVWSRDRSPEPQYSDRVATGYRIEVSLDGESWRLVASDADRMPRAAKGEEKKSSEGSLAVSPEMEALLKRQEALKARVRDLLELPKAYAGQFSQPEPTHRLQRGDPMQPQEVVEPGVLSFAAFHGSAPQLTDATREQRRRLVLARWIGSPDNPLTARVIVNRLWQYHFGAGLVSTPSDFGRNGEKPSHPGLLDWLASELMHPTGDDARPWSLKHIHRLIVMSATYRQSSDIGSTDSDAGRAQAVERAEKMDGSDRLLWRFSAHRLDAEPLRDAILATAGRLDLRMGGPGWSPFEPNENYVRVYTPKKAFGPEDFRRMVYGTVVRQRPDGVFGAFDCPDGGQIAPKRSRSTTPLQALNLLNSGFMMQAAGFFADRLKREGGDSASAEAARAFELAFQREPTGEEIAASTGFIRAQGLELFCRALLNANEFAYVY